MNPLIKKQFILEAWQYNQSLDTPFTLSYYEPHEYYHKKNWFQFNQSPSPNTKNILNHDKEKYFLNLVEKSIETERTNPNARKLIIQGDDTFLAPYFKHFFIQHPELQLDLLKFFNGFLNYNFKPTTFLKDFDKKQIEPFLTHINHWLSYSNEHIKELHELMIDREFNEGFRVSILKKYVTHNLKIINKNPSLSKGLENFLFNHYSTSFDLITPNVVAIQNRLSDLDEKQYFTSFSNKNLFTLYEELKIESLLKTFQIAGWGFSSYNTVIQLYHTHLTKQHDFNIKAEVSQSQKDMTVFITMKNNEFTLEDYKKDLFVLFKFYRLYPEQKLSEDNLKQIFLNHKLNENLTPNNKKTNANKI